MNPDLLCGPLLYASLMAGDVYTTERALRRPNTYETNRFNTGDRLPAAIGFLALSAADIGLSRSKSRTARAIKWGLRLGIAAVYANTIRRNIAVGR